MDLNNLILAFVLIFFSLFSFKTIINVLKKNYPKLLVDNQFNKPQSFHDSSVSTIGGSVIFFSLLILSINYAFLKVPFAEYLSFSALFFILGFIDDLKINIKPKVRLFLMIVVLFALIEFNDFYIYKTGIFFLDSWLQYSHIFSLIFVSLCFLFIINGSNLIDGYNGLLGIHSLIIFINLFFVNYFHGNAFLANLLFFLILITSIFILFNFPKAKVFLGDGGSYLLGTLIAVLSIKTSTSIPSISPFYFCILLFYLFYEVFFSFFRKLFKKISPLYPDSEHLHMLLYKVLLKKNQNKLKSNYSVSLIINMIYLILTIPAIFMMKNGMFCKYYSILFFLTYIVSYKKLSGKIK